MPSNPTLNPQSDRKIYQGSVIPRNFPGLPENWVSEWETFPSSDGTLQLYGTIHHPNGEAWKGERTLIVLHGMGEHGGRYLHFPHYLQSTVDSIYCLDHRGHGKSEGIRGHVDRFDLYAEDSALAISRLYESLMKRFGKAEIHLLGHSMGGLIALRTVFNHSNLPLASVSISSPALGIRVPLPFYKVSAARILSRVWSTLHMESEVDPRLLSHDLDVAEAYVSDRLVHRKGTPRLYTELIDAMEDTMRRTSGLNYPLLVFIPLKDEIVDPDATLRFYRNLKIREKLLKTYPNFYHESFNEIGKEQVFEDLATWIKAHSQVSFS